MLVNKIQLRNIMGVETLDLTPKVLTVISSKNGEGKTSIIEGIKALIGGGHDAEIIRVGQKSAEVVLELDSEAIFRKAIGKNSKLYQKGANQIPGGAQAALESLIDGLSSNPIDFFHADKGKRTEMLLDSVKATVSVAGIMEAIGCGEGDAADLLAGSSNHIDMLTALSKAKYDLRTGVNREAKGKAATVKQLTDSLPPASQSGAKELLASREILKAGVIQELEERHGDIAKELGKQTEKVKRQLAEDIEDMRGVAEETLEVLKIEANAAYDVFQRERSTQVATLTEEIGTLKAQAEEGERAAGTLQTVEILKANVKGLTAESDQLGKQIIGIEALRMQTLKSLPIPDLDFTADGDILVGGLPFDKLNTEKKVRFVLKLATLRAKDKPVKLICLDGLECLDDENFAMFAKAAEHYGKEGFQFIVTKVSNDKGIKVEDYS